MKSLNQKILILFGIVVVLLVLANLTLRDNKANLKLEKLKQEFAIFPVASVDHSKLPQLQKHFASPQDVTRACIGCHTERHKEVMKSSHWNWERLEYIEGRGIMALGKKNAFNNFCISASSNEQTCAKCHIGFGMKNNTTFDFENGANVDCMVCHDNSEEYHKGASLAGYPDRMVNLTKVAQSVGNPKKMNCGSCHFFSGGGNNVKHGDLEIALLDTTRDIDVHMGTDGGDMSCVDCHRAENHQMLGKSYSLSSMNRNRVRCESCHGELPHDDEILDAHGYKVACQTCHIPTYAKVNATKLRWDWSTAGKLRDGKPYSEEDADGNHSYLSIKGSFVWGKDVVPEYAWFNGTASHYLLGETFDPSAPLVLNPLLGDYDDPDAKIVPVKVHRANQIYDSVENILVQPKLFSATPGDGGYWGEFDWEKAATAGMREVGLPFSGSYGFARTEMNWPVNHMVAPKEKALDCADCHTPEGGRLASVGGFYLPGRDRNRWLDWAGRALLLTTLVGVVLHGGARVWFWRRRNGEGR
ncbi:MAG: tetrathionate reductase family octaheme c-type cytochrome [Acidobacteria bacterium]|nr:tetrathionate reductase family octaheme c-type cytochrome [Acidobacteriota bacterium]